MSRQITRVHVEYLSGYLNPQEVITEVELDGWQKMSKQGAVNLIETGSDSLYTISNTGRRTPVHVVVHRLYEKHLESKANGDLSDNLLSLPRF